MPWGIFIIDKMRLLFFLFFLLSFNINAQPLKFITYNIRYDNPKDGDNNWHKRKDWLAAQIKFYEPDVIGIQEGLHNQVTYLNEQLSEYSYVGIGRDDGKQEGEYSAIYYKNEKFEVIESSTFWLSETPAQPSKGWDADIKRICTYALFKDQQTEKQFWVFNTHYDHRGKEARSQSSKLILEKIDALNKEGLPVILMGDFNATVDDQPIINIKEKMRHSFDVSQTPPFGPAGTASGFDVSKPMIKQIDYIFVSGKLQVKKCAIISDSKNLHYPSDHLPVFAEIEME